MQNGCLIRTNLQNWLERLALWIQETDGDSIGLLVIISPEDDAQFIAAGFR